MVSLIHSLCHPKSFPAPSDRIGPYTDPPQHSPRSPRSPCPSRSPHPTLSSVSSSFSHGPNPPTHHGHTLLRGAAAGTFLIQAHNDDDALPTCSCSFHPPAIQPSFCFLISHFRPLSLFLHRFEPIRESSHPFTNSHPPAHGHRRAPCEEPMRVCVECNSQSARRLLYTLSYFTPRDFKLLHTSHTSQYSAWSSPCLGLELLL